MKYRVFQNPKGHWTAEVTVSVDAESREAAQQRIQEVVRSLPEPNAKEN